MKRIILILLALAGIASAAKPVIVRNKLHCNAYSVYVPADKDGQYWSRYTLTPPASGYYNCYPIHEITYGKVYTGKVQNYDDAVADGAWTHSADTTYNLWYEYHRKGAGSLKWTIPDGHNEIRVLYRTDPAGGECALHLGSAGDEDLYDAQLTSSSIDCDVPESTDKRSCVETIVATNSTATSRVLTLYTPVDTAEYAQIIGIRSFDTDSVGDPATASTGIAVGHDIYDLITPLYNVFYLQYSSLGKSYRVLYENTIEFTISWKPTAEAEYQWTAYGAHYGDGSANFTPDVNATLYIDGVSKGEMNTRLGDLSLGALFEADSIITLVQGYGDWERDGSKDANDILEVRCTQDFTATGVGIAVRVSFTGDVTINTGKAYVPILPIPQDVDGVIKALPSDTDIVIGSDYDSAYGNSIVVLPETEPFVIYASSLGPVSAVTEGNNDDAAKHKLYFSVSETLLEGAGTPDNGDVWAIGGFISIIKKSDIEKLYDIPQSLTRKKGR